MEPTLAQCLTNNNFNNNDSIHSVYVRSRKTAATPPPYSSYTERENIAQLPSLKLICFTHRGFYRPHLSRRVCLVD